MGIIKILKSRDTVLEEYDSMHHFIDVISGDDVLDTGSLSECKDKEVVYEFVNIMQRIHSYQDYRYIDDIKNINFIKSKDKISFYVRKNNGNILNLSLKESHISLSKLSYVFSKFENDRDIYSSDSLVMNKFNGFNIIFCDDEFYSREIIDESGNLKNSFNIFRDNLEIMFFYIDILLKRSFDYSTIIIEPYELFYHVHDDDNSLNIYIHRIRTDDVFIKVFYNINDDDCDYDLAPRWLSNVFAQEINID